VTGAGAGGRDALSASVRDADPAALLPSLRRGEETRLVLPMSLVDAVRLPTRPRARPAWAALLHDAAGAALGVPLVRDDAVPGGIRRAVHGDGAATSLLELLGGDVARPFEVVRMRAVVSDGERGLCVDQTHDSVVVGGAAGQPSACDPVVVKWSVHVEAGPSLPPAVAAARHLHAVGFTDVPEPVGYLVHHDGGQQLLLASVNRFLAGATDGWEWYVDDVLDWLAGRRTQLSAVEPAAAMGDLVARMHAAFATAWSGCATPVSRASAVDVDRWSHRALQTVDEAARVTTGAAGDRMRARTSAARAVVTAGLAGADGTMLTRVHGDLHVGQVLRWEGGYAVSDFDGNPVLPAAERDRPQPPARDVAGMLRAIDHVGRIVDRRSDHASADRVRAWATSARQAFLSAYRTTTHGCGHPGLLDDSLLPAFEVEQECRELVYASRHLPQWTYVPDAALVELLPLPTQDTG